MIHWIRVESRLWLQAFLACLLSSQTAFAQRTVTPANTRPLQSKEDIASTMLDEIDRFLDFKTKQAMLNPPQEKPLGRPAQEAKRVRFASILGVVDERWPDSQPEIPTNLELPRVLAESDRFSVYEIRWPVLADPAKTASKLVSIHGEGLLLIPKQNRRANFVVIPDADQSPEQLCGMQPGIAPEAQTARLLAEAGCRVIVPTTINRERVDRNRGVRLTNREYLYRSAFLLGRHLIGYELQKSLAAVDWFAHDEDKPIGICGRGDGGMLALYAAALEPRIDVVHCAGYFGDQSHRWSQPIDRNVFGLLPEFRDSAVAGLIYPRRLFISATDFPEVQLPGQGGAPGRLSSRDPKEVQRELERLKQDSSEHTEHAGKGDGESGRWLSASFGASSIAPMLEYVQAASKQANSPLTVYRQIDPTARHKRQLQEIDRHNQALLLGCDSVRSEFMQGINTSSIESYQESVEVYREHFRQRIIGHFDDPLLPFAARSRASWAQPEWTGHEIVLDVFQDVSAYGVLLLPSDLKPGERRPVVVCQHGLEGRPTDTFQGDHRAYHNFAAELCKRGFIVFAPQNIYLFQDRFRTLQRKANPLGKSLFSIMVAQHQQITRWLRSQPFVDGERIGFYGLSYGGKSAMRIPALVDHYCLSICSADFNEWVLKNASTRHDFSYVWTGEYEIFEWNLGNTFNYAEMAALICPRPFMVERGHFDGVGKDEWVAHEYAKVRHLYAAKLGIGDRTEIDWFVGPHTIHGKKTFDFLHRHLRWPKPN